MKTSMQEDELESERKLMTIRIYPTWPFTLRVDAKEAGVEKNFLCEARRFPYRSQIHMATPSSRVYILEVDKVLLSLGGFSTSLVI